MISMIKILVLTKSSLTFAQQETVANYILKSGSVCDFKYRLPISWFVSEITHCFGYKKFGKLIFEDL